LFVSKSPPSWGDVSSTTSPPVWISIIFGFVVSGVPEANNNAVPLLPVAKVKVAPEPDAYLNWTVYEPEVPFFKM